MTLSVRGRLDLGRVHKMTDEVGQNAALGAVDDHQ